jgi:hypothetical protein
MVGNNTENALKFSHVNAFIIYYILGVRESASLINVSSENQQMQQCYEYISFFNYINMFRALLCPSSGYKYIYQVCFMTSTASVV